MEMGVAEAAEAAEAAVAAAVAIAGAGARVGVGAGVRAGTIDDALEVNAFQPTAAVAVGRSCSGGVVPSLPNCRGRSRTSWRNV